MRINLHAPINLLSYGYVSTQILYELQFAGHDIALYPINEHTIECEQHHRISVQKSLSNSLNFDFNAFCVKIYHQFSLASRIGRGKYIGFPIFELDRFTPLEKSHINSCDLLFVPSKWAREVVYNDGDIGTLPKVVPLGVDVATFRPPATPLKPNKTIFLSIGKWEYRKGHDVLWKAFSQAFSSNDKVELWMMADNCFLQPKEKEEWEKNYKTSNIKLLPRLQNQAQVAYVMKKANFGVYPTRAEGWCLPALEGMACGLPPIITNYSGQTEYVNNNNSLLINFNEFEEANDGVWFKPGNHINQGKWGKFTNDTFDQLVEQLRLAHKLNTEQSSKLIDLKKVCLETANHLTWTNTANSIIQHLSI